MVARGCRQVGLILVALWGGWSGLLGEELPPALSGWKEWAVRGEEHRRCPVLLGRSFGERENHPCAFPGRLRLEVAERGGRFEIFWRVFQESSVPLPGSAELWPAAVRIGGIAVPVLEREGRPQVLLRPGKHQVEGELRWERRPESLPVPPNVAAVELVLDGRPVFPVQRESGAVWLGQPEGSAQEAEALTVQVYRLLSDGIPALLDTRVRLEVSGQGREELLGGVLPGGFAPISLAGNLPAMLETDGRMRVQVRPGSWELQVRARALAPLAVVEAPAARERWATEEVWSYQAQPWLRVTSVQGGRSVDPARAGVPQDWQELPAVMLSPGETLQVEERSRGLASSDSTRLQLIRTLWLDIQGGGISFVDAVSGRLERDFRLDLAEPLLLERATDWDQPILVTAGGKPGWRGVELRNAEVDLAAWGRLEQRTGALPVSGWQSPMSEVIWNLTLPPGRVLLAATGADTSPEAWVSRWTVLDLFLVLTTAFVVRRLLGTAGGVLALAFLVLSYQEAVGPLWCLLLIAAAALLLRVVREGRGAALSKLSLWIALLISVLVFLPFVARQLRLAIYPQLEVPTVQTTHPGKKVAMLPPQEKADEEGALAIAAQLPEVAGAAPQGAQQDEQHKKRALLQSRYAAANVFQAGGGEPSWEWRVATLSWSGPVMPDQKVRLVVIPPWLTRSLRVVMVGLLAMVLLRFKRAISELSLFGSGSARASAAIAGGILLIAAVPAAAQSTPDPALLTELRNRLLEPPFCSPNCAVVAGANVLAFADRLEVILTVHAEAPVAVPLPKDEGAWDLREMTVNGGSSDGPLRLEDGGWWVPLTEGVHHVRLAGRLAAVDAVELRFPVPPRRVEVRASGWEVAGLWEGRLRTDALTLLRSRKVARGPESEPIQGRIPPFVAVTRELELDLDWSVTTRVERVAPESGSLAVEVPLLAGESVLTPGFETRAGKVTAGFSPGVQEVSWRSRLEPVSSMALTAPDLMERRERWRVVVSPQWRAEFRGVPPSVPPTGSGIWVHQFDPQPGESLEMWVTQPQAIAGPTVAVDRCRLTSTFGKRASDHSLELLLRATRGGSYSLTLPPKVELREVKLREEILAVRPNEGRLTVPLSPGTSWLQLHWRQEQGSGFLTSLPSVELESPASNLELTMNLPKSRWVLGTSGPRIGPAVLYWGELAVMVLVALALTRLRWTPHSFSEWLLLGLGFSVYSWGALVVVVLWLLGLEARRRWASLLPWWRFNLVQVFLVLITLLALGCLVAVIPSGLLGAPDLHLTGNGSTPTELRWFADRTDGKLPAATAVTLPIWIYRFAMLAWALWLAAALVRWLRWAWRCLTEGGGWRQPPPPALPQRPAAPPSAAETA